MNGEKTQKNNMRDDKGIEMKCETVFVGEQPRTEHGTGISILETTKTA
jgi:hypothetical protein